jgi:hypothetical protein
MKKTRSAHPRHAAAGVRNGTSSIAAIALASLFWAGGAAPALAQADPSVQPVPAPAESSPEQERDAAAADQTPDSQASETSPQSYGEDAGGSETDILSRNTFTILLDARLVAANGERSWVNRGLGKTRFQGTSDGDYKFRAVPVEASLVWNPRFTSSLSANVSAAWQRNQENAVDMLEAFLNFLPQQTGKVSFSARAGLMWPEISLEHSTGGAWSVVNTITPSTINSWVGEEVKVVGLEATLHASLGEHQLSATGAVFGFNDTSGTLLSFRGWALHDEKATAFGHFPLPPLNEFMTHAQENRTRSMLEIDDRPGFYGRLDWRPPWPFGAALFYYDNRGDPEAFNQSLQWGWRTRFWNLGINADLGPDTRLLAQGMTGTTIMGFAPQGVPWVDTRFRSGFVLVTHQLGEKTAVTGRIEAFGTRERGSQMSREESEHGWSWTAAARHNLTDNLTLLVEALNVRSRRGTRAEIGLPPFQAQTVFQASLRFKL